MADLSFLALLLLLLPLALLFLILYVIVRPHPVNIPIKNRHVFITGGSSGIGLALAHQAATEGARVSILSRSLDKLEEAKNYIQLSTGLLRQQVRAPWLGRGSAARENKRRPPLTGIIAESSGAMNAEDVAKRALDGIKSASFIVRCNFEGLLLSIATAGLSPQRSFVMAFFEVVAGGLVRLVALCFQWRWYTSIQKWQAQNKRT